MDNNRREECPVCLEQTPNIAGSCDHPTCQKCIEKIIFFKKSELPPTYGPCPLCRNLLNLFELIDIRTNKFLYEKECFWDRTARGGSTDRPAILTGGCVFSMDGADNIGIQSFHFPSVAHSSAVNSDNEMGEDSKSSEYGSDQSLPFISYESPRNKEMLRWTMDDGSSLPDKIYFEPGCHFHSKTRTFHGTLLWDTTEQKTMCNREDSTPQSHCRSRFGSTKWDLILQFSPDYSAFNGHVLLKNKKQSPLDGRWIVTRVDEEQNRELMGDGIVDVRGGTFSVDDLNHYLVFPDNSNDGDVMPFFIWALAAAGLSSRVGRDDTRLVIKQIVDSGVDLELNPNGPPIGGVIRWVTNHPNYPVIEWKRETLVMGDSVSLHDRVMELIPRAIGRRYLLVDGINDIILNHENNHHTKSHSPNYVSETVWGNIFVQAFRAGLASYHFLSQEGIGISGAYISYERAPREWPPLDDGLPVPSRVPFRNIQWDPTTCTFRGVISWWEEYGTTWQGEASWRYEMIFDSELMCIVSGGVYAKHVGEESEVYRSSFGDDLVYLNAGVPLYFDQSLATERQIRDAADTASHHSGERRSNQQEEQNRSVVTNTEMEENSQIDQAAIEVSSNGRYLRRADGYEDSDVEMWNRIRLRLEREGASARVTGMLRLFVT